MIKLFCLKIGNLDSSIFSNAMSLKYNEDASKQRSSFAWRSLEKIILNELQTKLEISANESGSTVKYNYTRS